MIKLATVIPPPAAKPYPSDDFRLKHLEMLQAIITRMASNSFLIKGWAITLASALFALSAKDADRSFAFLAVFPALTFWALDAYYLKLERVFRNRYDDVAAECGMRIASREEARLWSTFLTPATGAIYVFIIGVAIAIGERFLKFGQ